MFKKYIGRKFLVCGLFSGLSPSQENLEQYKIQNSLLIEDNWERVKCIFRKNEYGALHPDLIRAFQLAQLGALCGLFIGGFSSAQRKKMDFMERNDTTLFRNKKDAYRKLTNAVALGFASGGLKYAPKIAFFTGGFSLLSSCCEAYRNKSGIIEHTFGGFTIGAFLRSHFGFKGTICGGLVGGILGTIYGIIVVVGLKLTGLNTADHKFVQYAFMYHLDRASKLQIESPGEQLIPLDAPHIPEHLENPLENLDDDNNVQDKSE